MTLPTDEEMRAEIPAIAKPYVVERDDTIAKLECRNERLREQTNGVIELGLREGLPSGLSAIQTAEILIERARADATRANLAESAVRDAEARIARADDELAKEANSTHDFRGQAATAIDTAAKAAELLRTTSHMNADHPWRAKKMLDDLVAFARQHKWASTDTASDETAAEAAATAPRGDLGRANHLDDKASEATEHGPCDCAATVADAITTRFDEGVRHYRMDGDHGIICKPALLRSVDGWTFDRAKTTCSACLERLASGDEASRASAETVEQHLHAAQLGARAHVVPHIRKAAELALEQGRTDDSTAFTAIASLVDGTFDPAILKYGEAFLRFVRGAG